MQALAKAFSQGRGARGRHGHGGSPSEKIVRPRPMLGPFSTRQWRPLVRSVSYGRGRQTPDRHGPQRRTRR